MPPPPTPPHPQRGHYFHPDGLWLGHMHIRGKITRRGDAGGAGGGGEEACAALAAVR